MAACRFGRQLVRAAEREARAWGYGELCLHCETKSAAALSLYLSEGFRVHRGDLQDGAVLHLKKTGL